MTDVLKECLESAENTEYGPEKAAWTRAADEIERLRRIEKSFLDLMKENSRLRYDNMLLNSWSQTAHEIIRIKEKE